jgi:subtilisin family serine protease
MKKLLLAFLFVFGVSVAAQELNYVSGEILVQLKRGVSLSNFQEEIQDVEIISSKLLSKPLNIFKISVNTATENEQDLIKKLYRNSNTIVAQLNHTVSLRATTPDDALFDNQWQYYQDNDRDIDADDAWDVTTGGMTPNGDVIVAGVVDGGFNINHPDLVENLYINTAEVPENNIDDDMNGYVDDVNGWNAYNSSGNINSDSHGTAVYGIVGAKGNNGIGVTGVNWDIKVMPISGSSGNESVVLEAYSYILESRMLYNSTNGAEGSFVVVTNASFGIDFGQPEDSPLWCAMYDTLGENGILSCGATINANQNIDVIGDVPTACPSKYMIAVTNTNISDVKVTQAGYGLETIDLGAPGQGTFTTSLNAYGGFGGTSGATPHVTGTIALLYSAPCLELADLAMSNPQLAAEVVRDLILNNVDPNESLEGITVTGGRLNVNNSMMALMNNCESLLAIQENNNNIFAIYPNPAKDIVNIKGTQNQQVLDVTIYNISGQKVATLESINNSVNLATLPQGMYIVQLRFKGDTNTYFETLIKK